METIYDKCVRINTPFNTEGWGGEDIEQDGQYNPPAVVSYFPEGTPN